MNEEQLLALKAAAIEAKDDLRYGDLADNCQGTTAQAVFFKVALDKVPDLVDELLMYRSYR